jgi:uncharacterized protein (DUF488 family)
MAKVYTIGHSTRSADELIALLRAHDVRTLVDVRRHPGSRRYPQFGREALEATLSAAEIRYVHAPELGGRRSTTADSPNGGWRNASFRGYADYMGTAVFRSSLAGLEAEAAAAPTAVMCAEAVPWRCHRNLIADALVARGHEVVHILSLDGVRPHTLNAHARVRADGTVVYPATGDDQTVLL